MPREKSPGSRSKFEAYFLLTLAVIAFVSVLRLRVGNSSTIHTVVSTRHFLRQGGGEYGAGHPQTLVTEVVIDSTTGGAQTVRGNDDKGNGASVDRQVESDAQPLAATGNFPLHTGFESAVIGFNFTDSGLDEATVQSAPRIAQLSAATVDGTQPAGGQSQPSVAGTVREDTMQPKQVLMVPPPEVPADFDWQFYLEYYPELMSKGITTELTARDHYASFGRAEGRVYKRIRLVLRYTACTGLMNQQYSHLAALTLAVKLGAEVVMPPSACRDSFGKHFSVFAEQNEVMWSPAATDALLNVDAIAAYWREQGITIRKAPAIVPFPDLTQPETAFPQYTQPEVDPARIVRLHNVYLAAAELDELIERVRVTVLEGASRLLRENAQLDLDYMVLDLPCTFFALRTGSNLPLVGQVAHSISFAPAIEDMAARIFGGVTANGARGYNSIHLRIEKDAADWSTIMGGTGVIWHGYVQAMRDAGFSSDVPLYVASGLLTYGATQDMQDTLAILRGTGLCGEIVHKELYVAEQELSLFNSEQKALVDFIVLLRGSKYVGFGSSTFSFYLRELRTLKGLPKADSVLVDASKIGTDPLFNSAGVLS